MATRGEIGKEIRLARKGLGYTQKSLAEKTQVEDVQNSVSVNLTRF